MKVISLIFTTPDSGPIGLFHLTNAARSPYHDAIDPTRKNPLVPHPIARHIRSKFRAIQDVKSASIGLESALTVRNHQPDIVVETWMNSRLFVYIIDRAPKTRMIKSVLKQNTTASIGSLFLIDAALLPGDGYCGRLRDWQDDLRVMNMGAIYAFTIEKDEVRVIQVNIDETTQRNEFVVWHTNDFPFDAVSVRRRDYQTNIRGSWYVGDIASPKFKRRISDERARQRFHYRTRQTRKLDELPAEQVNAAYLALEIEVGAGQEAVKEAFRSLARKYHPDVSEHEKTEAEKRFKEVNSAYDRIKSHRRWS